MKKIFTFLLAFCLGFQFCFLNIRAQGQRVYNYKTRSAAKKPVIKYGIASFYAKKFKGRKTSDGSSYSSTKLTAACNVLPLGTWVKVTNLKNKKTVIVQVNDHLHRKNHRLIDLSKAAAQKLGFISRGITRVKVQVLSKPKIRTAGKIKFVTTN